MKLTIIESPYASNPAHSLESNIEYARLCVADSLRRNEAPFASHLLYTQPGILDDTNPSERSLGMIAGFEWGAKASLVAVYEDHGISVGMAEGIALAEKRGIPVQYRSLGAN